MWQEGLGCVVFSGWKRGSGEYHGETNLFFLKPCKKWKELKKVKWDFAYAGRGGFLFLYVCVCVFFFLFLFALEIQFFLHAGGEGGGGLRRVRKVDGILCFCCWRRKFSHCSCRDSNSRIFNHESSALPLSCSCTNYDGKESAPKGVN